MYSQPNLNLKPLKQRENYGPGEDIEFFWHHFHVHIYDDYTECFFSSHYSSSVLCSACFNRIWIIVQPDEESAGTLESFPQDRVRRIGKCDTFHSSWVL